MTQSQQAQKPQKQTPLPQSPTTRSSHAKLGLASLLAQQAVADPAQANPGSLLKLQRAYGNRTVSGLTQARQGADSLPLVQRTKEDGKPEALSGVFDPNNFAKNTTSATWQKENYHRTIMVWLQAAWNAKTWVDQQNALNQVADACEAWVDKFGQDQKPKEATSTTGRRPMIIMLLQAVRQDRLIGPHNKQGQSAAGSGDADRRTGLQEGTKIAATVGGQPSGIADIHHENAADEKTLMDQEGGKLLASNPEFAMLEGANMLEGPLGIYNTFKDPKKTKLDKTAATLKGIGGVGQGGAKFSRGVGIKDIIKDTGHTESEWKDIKKTSTGTTKDEATENLEKIATWKQVGDSGGAFANGLATIAGAISFYQNMAKTNVKSTGQDYLLAGTERTKEALTVGQSGLKTVMGAGKASGDIGKTAIAGMATASAAIGIVLGTIEMVQGGLKIYQAITEWHALKKAQKAEQTLLANLNQKIETILEIPVGPEEAKAIEPHLMKLYITLTELRDAHQKYTPAMEAMKKIGNQRMEEGAFKMATGAAAVVSGALILSGIGAPVAVGIAAIGGILALTKAGMAWRRNAAADRLTTTALRLTDEGQPTATPDVKTPDYRTMEKRIYKCYYTHLPEVILKQTPAGLTKGIFLDVKRFAWSDKKKRVPYKQTHPIDGDAGQSIPSQDGDTVRNNWLVYSKTENNKKVSHKEEPTFGEGTGLTFSASAHKSKQAMAASRKEVVDALYTLGSTSWKPVEGPATKDGKRPAGTGSFVSAPVVPVGDADPETMKQYGQITLQALLSAANITPGLWQKWLDQSKGDEKKMKELIEKKLA